MYLFDPHSYKYVVKDVFSWIDYQTGHPARANFQWSAGVFLQSAQSMFRSNIRQCICLWISSG